MTSSKLTKSDYGIDAPPVIRNLIAAGIACLAIGLSLNYFLSVTQPVLSLISLICGIAIACCLLFTAALMIWSSKAGKIRFRERLLDSLALRGDETVVDIGCGRGLLLNEAARRLTTGKAIGIDLWQTQDQSGNSPDVTRANAQAEGVADRVEIMTADMRKIPLPEGSADAVVSNLAIHNIPDKQGRNKAIREIARILKPGGQLTLVDLRAVNEYIQTLEELGWQGVSVSGPEFSIFPPVRIVRGRKPSD